MSHDNFKHIGSPSIKLIEECSELIKAICKAERFGFLSHHPNRPYKTNCDEIQEEMRDVIESFENLEKIMKIYKANSSLPDFFIKRVFDPNTFLNTIKELVKSIITISEDARAMMAANDRTRKIVVETIDKYKILIED